MTIDFEPEVGNIFGKHVHRLLEQGETALAIRVLVIGFKYYIAKMRNEPLPQEILDLGFEDEYAAVSMTDIWNLLEAHSMIQLEIYGPIPDGLSLGWLKESE